MEVYIVKVCIVDTEYYMASMSYSISKSVKDAVVFKKKNDAYFYASEIERAFDDSLGKVEAVRINSLI